MRGTCASPSEELLSRSWALTGGLLEAPVGATEVLLPPADRVETAVGPFEEGEELAIESLAYWRSTIKRRKTEPFGLLQVGPARSSEAVIPARLRTIAPLAEATTPPTRSVDFGIKLRLSRGVEFVVNNETHHQDAPVKVGELQVWDVVNSTLMDHPFHLHGFFFQVLAVNGQPPAWRSWEDVVNLPPKNTTRIAWMPDDRPGRWMYHCHILEHHAAGMMAHFDVVRYRDPRFATAARRVSSGVARQGGLTGTAAQRNLISPPAEAGSGACSLSGA